MYPRSSSLAVRLGFLNLSRPWRWGRMPWQSAPEIVPPTHHPTKMLTLGRPCPVLDGTWRVRDDMRHQHQSPSCQHRWLGDSKPLPWQNAFQSTHYIVGNDDAQWPERLCQSRWGLIVLAPCQCLLIVSLAPEGSATHVPHGNLDRRGPRFDRSCWEGFPG